MGRTRSGRKIIRIIRQEYRRQLAEYWKLDFITRLKLAWAIIWKVQR